ncbi:MAG TPA: GNAT family N-acetyltransferase, partial [Rhizomicrobium sp.]
MPAFIRHARLEDADECGRICYEAFKRIADAHNFPPDFPNAEVAAGALRMLLGNPGFYAVAAERDGSLVGSNFLDERGVICGVGPVTVDPAVQNDGVGRLLMQAVMDRAGERHAAGIRLVQAGYHCRSLSLYSKLGFEVREHLACMQGKPLDERIEGYHVRAAAERDIAACNSVCLQVH